MTKYDIALDNLRSDQFKIWKGGQFRKMEWNRAACHNVALKIGCIADHFRIFTFEMIKHNIPAIKKTQMMGVRKVD